MHRYIQIQFTTFVSSSISIPLNVHSLKLTQFRNYALENFDFHPKINALVGLNGMGKTNVLDALYFLCLGKSYFSSNEKMVTMVDTDFFRLEAAFDVQDSKDIVVIKCKNGGKKEIEISGKKVLKISDHVGKFLCVMIAPDDIQWMLEGSEQRRNFINNTMVQMYRPYLEDLLLYNALLKRRNVVLKSFLETKQFDPIYLDSMTAGMIDPAHRIYEYRKSLVLQMAEIFTDTYAEISDSREACTITYQSQLSNQHLGVLMSQNLDKDRILARTSQGIHKDDLQFTMNGEPLRNFASQGQLKSFILALKITQYKILHQNMGQKPLLLLDDIFDKLDHQRVRKLLLLLIDENFGQVFITDTHTNRVADILDEIQTDYKLFKINDGKIIV